MTSTWDMKYRPVLGDDGVDEPQIPGDPLQVAEDPSGDEDGGDAPFAHLTQRHPHVRMQNAIARDGPVVVDGNDRESHALEPTADSARSVRTGHGASRNTCSVVDPNSRLSTAPRP